MLVLDGDRVIARDDPHLPAADLPAPPASASIRQASRVRSAQSKPTVRGELARLLAEGQIDQATHDAHRATYNLARKTYKKLTGARKSALGGALANAELIAAQGQLTPSRLPAVFLTVARNREWWSEGRLLSNGQRVEFAGSEIVWQYYTGQGIQIQVLGTFGRANGLWGAEEDEALRALLDEMLALASDRGGVMAWEYLFRFGSGSPPWASGMAQATGAQALARAAGRLAEPAYREAALRALALFETPPPNGVRVDRPGGPHYLLYSYAPDLHVYNGFLQAVIGLGDVATLTGDPRARALAESGDAAARADAAAHDTGAWSLYSTGTDPAAGRESSLHYHDLVSDFLETLCKRTAAPEYCGTAERFRGYMDVA
ncbi:MAG TPA: D-glucuronyl C5-epimerase family protein, partial [Thermoleophilaceae bacterium]